VWEQAFPLLQILACNGNDLALVKFPETKLAAKKKPPGGGKFLVSLLLIS
jgi:hypothetical protein